MRFESQDFKGLTPAIDPRKSNDLFALAGRNYALDAKGPTSCFGNFFLTPYPIGRPQHAEGCRLRLRTGDRVFTFTGDGIIEWREDLGNWRFIYLTGDISPQPYRWTYGYLNGYMFFCHPAAGILAYHVDTDICLPLVSSGVPQEPLAICINNGRLIVIDELTYYWSGPGDGTNWIVQLGGAGFQAINDRIPGFPIMVTPYARGTLTWTTGGVMRSEFTGDAAVFRHRALQTEYRPINSYCTLKMDDDSVVILDERGFFSTKGEAPQPLTPLFNEHLIDYLQKYDLKLGNNVRVEWDDLKKRVYLSLSLSESDPLYEKAFVLYTNIDKWGTFDEEHYGILPQLIQNSDRADDYFGFVDSTGRVKYWDFAGSREILPTSGILESYYPLVQKPAAQEPGENVVILSSSFIVNTISTALKTGVADYYPIDGNSPETPNLTGLDSVIQFGMIRARSDVEYDRMIEITRAFVGNVTSGDSVVVGEDFNLIPDGTADEDWNEVADAEDFGLDPLNYINHGFRVIGTMDGNSLFMSEEPMLVEFNKAGRHFSCSVLGLWHILEIDAIEVGEAFHIQAFELTAVDGGSLN